jgi:drug/metabolite transporter superfamily protein YnfA
MIVKLYLLAAVLEIAGCFYMVKKIYWLSVPCLIAFGYVLSLQPYEPAKSYLIYGGIYILSCLGLAMITDLQLTPKDYLGVGLMLTGIVLMLL